MPPSLALASFTASLIHSGPVEAEFALKHPVTASIVGRMSWFRKSVVLFLLALWLPATMHCTLETLPEFSFLQWCCGGDATQAPDRDCTQDTCTALESGFYMIEDNPAIAFDLGVELTLPLGEWLVESALAPTGLYDATYLSPPGLPRPWQFLCRAASSPRAPSLIA